MPLKIYNTLTGKKEEFVSLEPGRVKMYACGVTVYDLCHIGHSRSLFTFELVKRYLAYKGYDVRFVRNITDIDDKIIDRARETGGDARELADKYIQEYYRDLRALGLSPADVEPRATEHIPQMVEAISGLIHKGYAYCAGGEVYFDVDKIEDYGRLSHQDRQEMLVGVRIRPDEKKRHPLDFALWKASKAEEPGWPSPWGRGRPGWHIECSVMSVKYLGKTLDIHGGGRDLIFPHHENEIAQAEALNQRPFARYWMHHGLLTINGQKMSKSLGNFVTIREVTEIYPDGDYLRLFFLSAHYRSPVDYTRERMEEAKKDKQRFGILLEKVGRLPHGSRLSPGAQAEIDGYKQRFIRAMDDDLNTPQALATLFDLNRHCNKLWDRGCGQDAAALRYGAKVIGELGGILGLSLRRPPAAGKADLTPREIEEKIAAREALRKQRRYGDADKIRKDLEKKGIILEDTKDGNTGYRLG